MVYLNVFLILFLIPVLAFAEAPEVHHEAGTTIKNFLVNVNGARDYEQSKSGIEQIFPSGYQQIELREFLPTKENLDQPDSAAFVATAIDQFSDDFQSNNIVLNVFIEYPEDPYQWLKAEDISADVRKLWDKTANDISVIVRKFRGMFPDGITGITATGHGFEVAVRFLEKSDIKMDRVLLNMPTVYDHQFMESVLQMRNYSRNEVIVIHSAKAQIVSFSYDMESPYYRYIDSQRGDDVGRFAEREEIFGIWEMIPFPDVGLVNKVNPWPMPYQWFGIYEDGTFVTMMTNEKYSTTRQELEKVFEEMKPSAMSYQYEGGMLTVIYPDKPDYVEHWGVNFILRDTTLGSIHVLPGDLLMTLDDGQQVVYYRHLRKLY